MSIDGKSDLQGLERAAAVAREVLETVRHEVRPGVTTGSLDAIARRIFKKHGARSAPTLAYGFPGYMLISIDDEAVHGVPGDRVIHPGDVVKLDVTPELDGYVADTAITVAVPPVTARTRALIRWTRRSLAEALEVARAGAPINAIGRRIEETLRPAGLEVVRELCGHGVGHTVHEPPQIPSAYEPWADEPLTENLVITIEPIVTEGSPRVFTDDDGWTIRTRDRSRVAHFEHTLVIREGSPLVLTA
ncbi:hypothetical protein ABI59_08940 [Acidobacteria bacterium Mor1]|nr:hypothetical protein ABI59_08940 [Acidobacteria bacterium Mor1]